MIDIIYAVLPMCAQTEKTTFSCKDDQCKALFIYWSGGEGLAHLQSTHGAGHIPLCGIFFFSARIYFLPNPYVYVNHTHTPHQESFLYILYLQGLNMQINSKKEEGSSFQTVSVALIFWKKVLQYLEDGFLPRVTMLYQSTFCGSYVLYEETFHNITQQCSVRQSQSHSDHSNAKVCWPCMTKIDDFRAPAIDHLVLSNFLKGEN